MSWSWSYGAISAYHHWNCEFELRSWRGALDTTLCDQVFQRLATGHRFSLVTPVSSTNKTDSHDLTDISVKVTLNTINQPTCLSVIKLLIIFLLTPKDMVLVLSQDIPSQPISAPVKILQSTNVSDTANYQIQLLLATNMAVQCW